MDSEQLKLERPVYKTIARWLIAFALAFCLVVGILQGRTDAAPNIVAGPLPGGQVGSSYSAILSATCNGTCTWSLTGGFLPAGLLMSGGIIQGTPTTVGTYPFTVTVTDPTGSSSQNFIISITAPALTFSTTSIPGATVGQNYAASVLASGGTGTITYAVTNGSLPPGLIFNAGQLSGIPARGSAGTYLFSVTATSSTTSAQQSFTLTVEKGTYDATVSISPGLVEGQTRLYVGNIPKGSLRGGESAKLTGLDPDTVATVSVDSLVSNPSRTDIRYKAESNTASLSEGIGQITFNYFTEDNVNLTSDPSGVTSISGSGWYREGSPLTSTAADVIPKDTDSQYKFSYWLIPGGDKINSQVLNISVKSSGKYIATYEMYFKLNIVSLFGNSQGGGWQKAGSVARWSIAPAEAAMSGILGFFGGKYKALLTSGTETIDGPKTVTIQWDPDYTTPAVTIPIAIIVVAGLVYGFYTLFIRSKRPEPMPYPAPFQSAPPPYFPYPPPPPPPPPQPAAIPPPQTTVVMIGENIRRSPQNTREQLMEKFGELLQKYEDELSQGRELPSSPDMLEFAPITEKKSLAAPEIVDGFESTSTKSPPEECGSTTKKLLRTVVTQWRNTNVKPITVTPGDKKSAALAGGRTVTWTRDTYNEWELHICKLPIGHKGTHKGATEIVYSMLDTINEERNYGPKQPLKPPSPHYTDGIPELDIPTAQIIPPDQLPA